MSFPTVTTVAQMKQLGVRRSADRSCVLTDCIGKYMPRQHVCNTCGFTKRDVKKQNKRLEVVKEPQEEENGKD